MDYIHPIPERTLEVLKAINCDELLTDIDIRSSLKGKCNGKILKKLSHGSPNYYHIMRIGIRVRN